MIERCKHIGKDGHRCGSYAFNLYKDDIEQGDLCDVHYWQTKAQRTGVKLTDEEIWQIATDSTIGGDLHADKFARAIESAHGIKENT